MYFPGLPGWVSVTVPVRTVEAPKSVQSGDCHCHYWLDPPISDSPLVLEFLGLVLKLSFILDMNVYDFPKPLSCVSVYQDFPTENSSKISLCIKYNENIMKGIHLFLLTQAVSFKITLNSSIKTAIVGSYESVSRFISVFAGGLPGISPLWGKGFFFFFRSLMSSVHWNIYSYSSYVAVWF